MKLGPCCRFQSLKLVWREWLKMPIFPILYVLSFVLSFGAFMVLDSFQGSVNQYLSENQQATVGGDIVVRSSLPFPEDLNEVLALQEASKEYEFSSIVASENGSVLSQVKSVGESYPLYGSLDLVSGQDFQSLFEAGTTVVAPAVLDRLELQVGDDLSLGGEPLRIVGVIAAEPDEALAGFGFGPRVLVHNDDKQLLGLVGAKSRVTYEYKIKVRDSDQVALLESLKEQFPSKDIRIRGIEDVETPFSIFTRNFSVFLKLVVLGIMLLSVIGAGGMIKTFLERHYSSIAIRQNLGETMTEVIGSYRSLFVSFTILGVLISVLAALGLLFVMKAYFNEFLPPDLALEIQLLSILKTLVIGILFSFLFSSFLLEALRGVKPAQAFRKNAKLSPTKSLWSLVWLVLGVGSFVFWLWYELGGEKLGLYIAIGFPIILVVLYGVIQGLFWGFERVVKVQRLLFRLALQNLFRKKHQTTIFVMIISLTLFILGIIYLLSYNLQQQFVTTYPPNAPNMFFLDVTKDQRDELNATVGGELNFFPVVRGRVLSVNGETTQQIRERKGEYGDPITRTFNFSYGDELIENERLVDSEQPDELFENKESGRMEFSILDEIARSLDAEIGDEVVFLIQGVELEAKITSIRTRLEKGPSPYFYFLFREADLADAPQILFATARVDQSQRQAVQNQVAKAFPNVSTIDVTSVAKRINGLVSQLTQVTQVFTSLGIITGLLLFLASLVSTSQDRIRESVYFRLMGMRSRDIYALSVFEFIVLGLWAFIFGLLLALGVSWWLLTQMFEIGYVIPCKVLFMSLVPFLIVLVVIGMIYTKRVVMTSPIGFLRKYQDE